MSFLAAPRAIVRRVFAEVLAPPPPLDLNAWAARNIVFGDESPFPGPYDPSKFPFFRRILEVLSPDYPVSMVVLMKSAQLGGTVLAQIFVAAILHLAPRPVLYVHPIDSNAKKWKRSKFSKMVKACVALAKALQPEGARIGNTAMYWARRDGRGHLQLAGANSPSQLSMDSFPIAVHDDLAKWAGDNGAGDPETQADSRSKAFLAHGGKVFKIGTPGEEPGCRITADFRLGTRERWHVPCPHCGVLQLLEWQDMAACLDESDPDDAHFRCKHCAVKIEERHREWMNAGGQWVAERPGADVASFHLWAAWSPLEAWGDIARAWLKAKGSPQAERTFLNDTAGQPWQAATSAPEWSGLKERAEAAGLPRGVIPAGFLLLTIGVDCQLDRTEYQVVAWGPKLQRVVIDWGVSHYHVGTDAARRELDELLNRTYADSLGNRRRIDMLDIDGGMWRDDVFAWAKSTKSSRVMISRGAKADTAPPLARVKTERNAAGEIVTTSRRWYNVGVSGLKSTLYSDLRKTDPLETGYIGFVAGLEDEFYWELTSESRKPRRTRSGATEWRWVPLPNVDQEQLDCHLYAQAAAIRCGWSTKGPEAWEQLRGKLEVQPAAPDLFSLPAANAVLQSVDPVATATPTPEPIKTRQRRWVSPFMET